MRPDLLPENNLEKTIADLERLAGELKGRQYVGADSMRFFTSASANTYDWTGLLPASPQAPATGTQSINIFAEAENMATLYGEFIIYLYVNGVRYTYAQYLAALEAGTATFFLRVLDKKLGIGEKNKLACTVVITGNKTDTVGIKAYVVATDNVTITAVPL